MKATELQLGNLVLLSDKIIRVDAIHKRKIGYHVRFDKLKFVFEYIVNPIPLTPEILEKNGFVNQDGDEYKLFVADAESYYFGFYSVRYYFSLKLLCVVKDNKNGAQSEVKGQYTYVHELQNALQLCGIEKAIEL